jgi:hypothetical protein
MLGFVALVCVGCISVVVQVFVSGVARGRVVCSW